MCARLTSGLVPTEITTMSQSIAPPSEKARPVARPSPSTSLVSAARWNLSPASSSLSLSMRPAVASSCRFIRVGWSCITVTSSPSFCSPTAASRPRSPPPITAALLDTKALAVIFAQSSIVLKTKTPSLSAPGTGITTGREPVANMRVSYGEDEPSAATTFLYPLIISTIGFPRWSVTPFRENHPLLLRVIPSTVESPDMIEERSILL